MQGEVSMIERVARAICEAEGMLPDVLANTAPPEKVWTLFIPQARAAIEAMREPTEAMKVAGCQFDDPLGELVDWRSGDVTRRETVTGVFNALIDVALTTS